MLLLFSYRNHNESVFYIMLFFLSIKMIYPINDTIKGISINRVGIHHSLIFGTIHNFV